MDTIFLNKRKNEALDAQEAILKAAMTGKRHLTAEEKTQFENLTNELNETNENIARVEAVNKGKLQIATPRETAVITDTTKKSKFMAYAGGYKPSKPFAADVVDEKYVANFWKACKTPASFQNWMIQNAALGEGGTTADGSALVPIETDPTIPYLQPVECSARSLSKVITTTMNINLPYQSAKSVAAIKAETNNSNTGSFGTSVPQFATTELQAYVVGNSIQASWELLEDAKAVNDFIPAELQRAIRVEEEDLFVNGSGTGEPQGYLGNATTAVGAHITTGAAALGINPIIETMGSLNAAYYTAAKWLVNRQEFNRLLEAQIAADQFQTFITFDPAGGARLFGYEVMFSAEMPVYSASPSTQGAWLFGDFASFAVIGDRGDSNIRLRVDPFTGTLNGVTYIVGYRRTDQRILLEEAVVQLNTSS